MLSGVPFVKVSLAPVDPVLFWIAPQDKVSKVNAADGVPVAPPAKLAVKVPIPPTVVVL
jgi:hypothetical protein